MHDDCCNCKYKCFANNEWNRNRKAVPLYANGQAK